MNQIKPKEALTTEHARRCLERALEVALGRLVEDVNVNLLRVIDTLEAHKRLHEERLSVAVGNV